MRSTRTPASSRGGRHTGLAAVGLVAALSLTATACNGDDSASDKPAATATQASGQDKVRIPSSVADKLKEHGVDVDKWADGGWKNWDKDKWLSEAKDGSAARSGDI
ncbi:hypothetical protein [Streptomyces sp. NBC_00988]|uniref:hypothetical protein n=1 Tax=Streptomyces sp. NBC_00988 TaxID=2903704 RepID=UPI0038654F31